MVSVVLMLLQAWKVLHCCWCRRDECCTAAVAGMMIVAMLPLRS